MAKKNIPVVGVRTCTKKDGCHCWPQFCHFRAISKGPTIISCLILDLSSIIHNFSANEAVHKGEHEVSAHVLTMLMNDTVQDEVGQAWMSDKISLFLCVNTMGLQTSLNHWNRYTAIQFKNITNRSRLFGPSCWLHHSVRSWLISLPQRNFLVLIPSPLIPLISKNQWIHSVTEVPHPTGGEF